MSYDTACHRLALEFLYDVSPEQITPLADKLAQVIQDAIEDFISEHENYDPTPWCHQCGARTRERCKCGPIADNN